MFCSVVSGLFRTNRRCCLGRPSQTARLESGCLDSAPAWNGTSPYYLQCTNDRRACNNFFDPEFPQNRPLVPVRWVVWMPRARAGAGSRRFRTRQVRTSRRRPVRHSAGNLRAPPKGCARAWHVPHSEQSLSLHRLTNRYHANTKPRILARQREIAANCFDASAADLLSTMSSVEVIRITPVGKEVELSRFGNFHVPSFDYRARPLPNGDASLLDVPSKMCFSVSMARLWASPDRPLPPFGAWWRTSLTIARLAGGVPRGTSHVGSWRMIDHT